MPDTIRLEIERQCAIGAGTCSHETGQLDSTGLLTVDADLDIATLERVAAAASFRHGVASTVQAIVDDIGGLCRRRADAHANAEVTQVMVGLGRRIAAMPLPSRPDDAPLQRSSILLDFSGFTDRQVVAAAMALRDSEVDIIDAEILAMPVEEQEGMRVLLSAHMPPPWLEMDEVRRQTYMYRARRMISALAMP